MSSWVACSFRNQPTTRNTAGTQTHIRAGLYGLNKGAELAPHQLGEMEGQIERLTRIQARIAKRLISLFELFFR